MRRVLVAALWSMALACGSVSAAPVCALIGDSIAAGSGLPVPQTRFVHILQVEHDVIIRDLSSPGATLGRTDFMGFNRPDLDTQLSSLGGAFGNLSCIIVQAGTNDFGASIPWEASVEGLVRVLKWAKVRNKRVLVVLPIWRANEQIPNKLGHNLNKYRYMLAVSCTIYGQWCTVANPIGTLLGSAAGAGYYQSGEVAVGKQLHPDAAGHRLMADWIAAVATSIGIF